MTKKTVGIIGNYPTLAYQLTFLTGGYYEDKN